ncbi:MAG: LUD domain-containing protein [Desulfosarcinaceae bacterium]|nr:LUD domain-containing protein [Desulfosarcinaceae bacterium]
MQRSTTLKGYRKDVGVALKNEFLRKAMDNFAVAYRASRENAFRELDSERLIQDVAELKDRGIDQMEALLDQFIAVATSKGVHVHLAKDSQQANEIIATIAAESGAKRVIKSKSMTAEETLLNPYLEIKGLDVTETDLGEWIIQLRGEGPSHMVMPAIHLSRYQVADLFTDVTGAQQSNDIEKLVKVARRELRQKFVDADVGISGANFAIAETGTIGLTTNEGNARLVTTLPKTHIALIGLEKLVPTIREALAINRVLPRNATGQAITSYVTWITGPAPWGGEADGRKALHIVFLDNGRRALAKDRDFSQVLRCVRCGACANVCPIYRMIGGHQYGHIYIGAIGLILTYFFHGRAKARNLVQNCINCGACKAVCAAGIDLPSLIKAVHEKILGEEGHPLTNTLLNRVLRSRKLFHGLLRSTQLTQRPVTTSDGYLRHLPMIFAKEHRFRALPSIAEKPFRDRWATIAPSVAKPRFKVALFSGCVQDFVYPEHLEAATRVMAEEGVALAFPMDQSCCGLPVQMMGESKAARDVAIQNVLAMAAERYDYIVTLCASCASHLKKGYPKLLADHPSLADKAERFADKVLPFSSFMVDVLALSSANYTGDGEAVTYHAPCHLCRGLGIREAPRALIDLSGHRYAPASEEETCCGFGGTYSSKFPRISAEILETKLKDFQATGAERLVTECPGCLMQLRGGIKQRGIEMEVLHMAELLERRRK